jgi:hypothetical protein
LLGTSASEKTVKSKQRQIRKEKAAKKTEKLYMDKQSSLPLTQRDGMFDESDAREDTFDGYDNSDVFTNTKHDE